MQRLPSDRIQRADEAREIDLEVHPAPTGLRSRDEAAFGARADLLGVHVEEGGGFLEGQGAADEGVRRSGDRRVLAVSAGAGRGIL